MDQEGVVSQGLRRLGRFQNEWSSTSDAAKEVRNAKTESSGPLPTQFSELCGCGQLISVRC